MTFYEKLKLVFSDVFTHFLPIILTFLKEHGPTILEIALKVIPLIALSLASGSDDDKRKRAFKIIMEEAKAKGLNPSESTVNAAIEIAVAKFKEDRK